MNICLKGHTILKEAGVEGQDMLVASGMGFADYAGNALSLVVTETIPLILMANLGNLMKILF